MNLFDVLYLVGGFSLGLLVSKFLPSYFSKKGENLATKQDIAKITKEVESVKSLFKNKYDLSKAERDLYGQIVKEIESFLSEIRKEEFNSNIIIDVDYIMKNPILLELYLKFINSINLILSKSFVFLGEANYLNLKKAIDIRRKMSFKDIRLELLNAMRKSIYPETEISSKKGDLREFYYPKK